MDHLSYCKRHTLVSNQPPPFQNVTTSIIIDQFSKRTFCLSLLLLSISRARPLEYWDQDYGALGGQGLLSSAAAAGA